MKSVKEESIKFDVVKKWQEQLPDIEKKHDLKKALNPIKEELTEKADKFLYAKGFNFKQRSRIGNVLGNSIVQMGEEILQEIDLGELK
jgi:hypothetical protein